MHTSSFSSYWPLARATTELFRPSCRMLYLCFLRAPTRYLWLIFQICESLPVSFFPIVPNLSLHGQNISTEILRAYTRLPLFLIHQAAYSWVLLRHRLNESKAFGTSW